MNEVDEIVVDDVSVAYPNGKVALRNASLRLPKGSICGLIGVNGGGKSTLFKAIMGFVPVQSGFITIHGMSGPDARRKNLIAYVPQSEEVDWSFPVNVEQAVMMGRYGYMGIRRVPKTADFQAVDDALHRVNMTEFRHRQIGELSGGQRQRAFLARALAQRSSIMLLDEPLSGVDTGTQRAIIDLLRSLRDDGHTIVISTHDLASVDSYCDQVVMVNGTVVAAGPTREVLTVENVSRTFGGGWAFVMNLATSQQSAQPGAPG